VHRAISDPPGDFAIFEYVAGKLTIHHSHQDRVMTNSPIDDQQLALDVYGRPIGGLTRLPGARR
jgi:penicillin V acylase-like amidase (Ntn superfamily)